MSAAKLVFSIIAATTGVIAVWFAWHQHKDRDRARLARIVELVGEAQEAAQVGWPTSFRPGMVERRLRAELVDRDDLPALRDLTAKGLSLSTNREELARATQALDEAQAALAKYD